MARTPSYDREQALDAAMTLFWRKGYHATSLKDLETTLRMKPGSIYAAFQSKEALFRATLDRYAARMADDMQATVSGADSALTGLQKQLLSLADLTPRDKPSTACMLVKSLLEVSQEGELRDIVRTHLDRVQQSLTEAVRAAQDAGELPQSLEPERVARRLQTYIFGLKIQAQRESDPERMNQLCQDLAGELARLGAADRQAVTVGEG
ncbi:TetR/AcrR family transcriptional regulator [Paracoccus seriniphilus]|nr:TetR/AcrR family transcriptional regulator [Paracoccus seriniphilus]WCR15087.1 TetR/AcrR family transcriptional regulator [Paracoccus seriniphilus]